jgi:hypothetical protein
MRVRFSPAAFMPRSRKTSTQPKRKPKKPEPVVEKVYPEYIKNFKKQLAEKTPFILKVDQYSKDAAYHIGVLAKQGRTHRCIWMVGFATGPEHVSPFWTSQAYKEWTQNHT